MHSGLLCIVLTCLPLSACLLSLSSVLCSDTLLMEKPLSLGDLAAIIADPGANPACLSASQTLHCALVGLLTKDVGDALYNHLNEFDDSSVSSGPGPQHTDLVPTSPPVLSPSVPFWWAAVSLEADDQTVTDDGSMNFTRVRRLQRKSFLFSF